MKEQVNFSDFCDKFHGHDRDNQFSYEGKRALFEYLEDLSEDIGEDIELDPIALCCEYSEYDDLEDLQSNYTDIESMEDLQNHTQVIECSNGHIIIQDF